MKKQSQARPGHGALEWVHGCSHCIQAKQLLFKTKLFYNKMLTRWVRENKLLD